MIDLIDEKVIAETAYVMSNGNINQAAGCYDCFLLQPCARAIFCNFVLAIARIKVIAPNYCRCQLTVCSGVKKCLHYIGVAHRILIEGEQPLAALV